VAATFSNDTGVIYDLFNEPFFYWIAPGGPNEWACLMNGCTLSQYETGGTPFTINANWKSAGMNELISDVRGTGAQNVIMVAGTNWARDTSGWLANRPAGTNIVAAWHSYPSGNPTLTSECAATACWNSVVAPLAAQVPVVVGETGDSAAGPETYLPSFLPWAGSHGLSVVAWTWNAWTNPDDVLVTNMQSGGPTAGEGVTYRGWLAGQGIASPVPVQVSSSKPPVAAPPAAKAVAPKTSAPPVAHPTAKAAPVKSAAPVAPKVPSQAGGIGSSVGEVPVASVTAADRSGLRIMFLGFILVALVAISWGAVHLTSAAASFIGHTTRLSPRA
jgi:hypothetical protein